MTYHVWTDIRMSYHYSRHVCIAYLVIRGRHFTLDGNPLQNLPRLKSLHEVDDWTSEIRITPVTQTLRGHIVNKNATLQNINQIQ